MNSKFKRHQKVKLLLDPDPEYVEYHTENTEAEKVPIKKGMSGEINMLLPNGDYHVKILSSKGEELAYIVMPEEFLEEI